MASNTLGYFACSVALINIINGAAVDDVVLLQNRKIRQICSNLVWLFVGPTGVYLLDFFCSGIQFNLLLSPYPCFISLLYLDLYV